MTVMSAIPLDMADKGRPAPWARGDAGGGSVAASIRHLIDLARFFPEEGAQWPDALASETRRHLAGCIYAVEMSLRTALESTAVAGALPGLPPAVAWEAVCRQPHLLSSALLSHMRLRAAAGLLGRRSLRTGGDPAAGLADGSSQLLDDGDRSVAQTALALAQAEARWSADGGGPSMQPDLPAEHYGELVWTVAALLCTALSQSAAIAAADAIAAVADSAGVLLRRHDEEHSALALAALLARRLNGRAAQARLLGQALKERRYVLFSALAGVLTDTGAEAVLDTLVHGSARRLAALCHALDGAPSDYRHLLTDLGPVRGDLSDAALVALADAYDRLTGDEVAAEMEALRRPAPLRAKLALIASPTGAG